MTTGLVTHTACLEHLMPPGHPERVERLHAVLRALDPTHFPDVVRIDAPRATREALVRVHEPKLVDAILNARIEPGRFARIDADTAMSPGSAEAALRAAGAVVEAVDAVMGRRVGNAFCAVRPPGHHAERGRSMGFCLFNSVAVGALHARAVHGLERIAVIDLDVHHANATQNFFLYFIEVFYDGMIFYRVISGFMIQWGGFDHHIQ
jgi:acetoin utilization deacetylase AcuC-like enzyme